MKTEADVTKAVNGHHSNPAAGKAKQTEMKDLKAKPSVANTEKSSGNVNPKTDGGQSLKRKLSQADDSNTVKPKKKRRKKKGGKDKKPKSASDNGELNSQSASAAVEPTKKKRRKKNLRLSDERLKAYGLNPEKVKYTHPHLKKFKK